MRWPLVSRRAYDVLQEDRDHLRNLVLILIEQTARPKVGAVAQAPEELLDPRETRKTFNKA